LKETCVQIPLLLLIIFAVTLLYVTRWIAIESTAILTIVVLALTGILKPEQAFAGFSNSGTLTVAAMFVLSGGLVRTGALESVTFQLARFSQGSPRRLLLLLSATIPSASAFMNNTPIVVMMMPVVVSLSRRFRVNPSKLLLPVSYFAILGGTITLLGTSTNILVDDLYRQAGGPGFSLFDFAPLGLIYAVVGVGYILTIGYRLLPDRTPPLGLNSRGAESTYVTEVIVSANSKLIGRVPGHFMQVRAFRRPAQRMAKTFSLRRRIGHSPSTGAEKPITGIELLEIVRAERLLLAEDAADLPLAVNDRLLISGGANEISAFLKETQSSLATVLADDKRVPLSSLQQTVVEAVVLPGSSFSGREVGTLELHRRFGVDVMGVQRQGRHQSEGLRALTLRDGDVLLLRGSAQGLRQLRESARLLLVEGVEETIVRSDKNRYALVIMLGVILLATLTKMPIAVLALGGAVLMILTRCLRPEEALRSLDPPTLLLLAGTIPLGIAIQSTGLAALIVDWLLSRLGHADPRLFISMLYLLTSIVTELLSNNAVAVLLTPIALQLAITLGIDPKPLLMAVAFGASASFMTPIGYQTNAIVMGPGGYTFKDYLKIGTPLNLLLWIVATICIPWIWPM